jgi:hypothetical protein
MWTITVEDADGDTFSVELVRGCHAVSIIADVTFENRVACLWGVHILGAGANRLGSRLLLSLVPWALEYLDVDEIRIAGASRTSGAGPGCLPASLAFRLDGARRIGGDQLG